MVEPSTTRKKSRFWLYLPFGLLLALVAAWSAYWLIARGQIDKGVDQWIAEQRAKGAVVEYTGKSLGGFPYRFELVLDDPVYQPPGGSRWEGEQLRLVMQPWNWRHVIAYSPGRNLVTEPSGLRQTVNVDKASAISVSWNGETIERIGMQLGNATALINGHTYATSGFSLNLKPREGSEDDLMIALQWDRFTINAVPQGAEFLGDTIGPSRLIGEVRGFFPAYEAAGREVSGVWPALLEDGGAVEVAQLLLDWGPLDLGAQADLTLANGRSNGAFKVRIESADELKQAMIDAGHWSQQEQIVFGTLAPASRDGGFLTLPVIDDTVYVGPVPLGKLPGNRS